MDPKRYPRRGKIRRKSRNRKNINTKNIHFIDTSLLLPRILLSYHVKTRPFSCASFSVIIDVHRPAIPILPPFHAFCISVVYTYYRKIHPFSAQHNYISIHSHFPVVAYTPRRGRRNLAQGKMSVANDTLGSKGRASVTSGTLGLRTTHVTAP